MLSINVSALADTPKGIESSLRNAWETNNCEQAKSLMDEMNTASSLADYYYYQGEAFEYGYCIDKDINNAITAYKKAYGVSQKRALMRLAVLYLREKKDIQTAQKWLRTVAFYYAREPDDKVNTQENQSQLIKSLNEIYSNDLRGRRAFPEEEFDQAIKWATKLFGSSHDRIYEYALIFEKGTKGYPVNQNAANRLLHRVVMQDYPPAAWHYAKQLLNQVKAGTRSPTYPLNFLKTAAHGGIVDAQVQVGRTYRDINKKPRYLERAYEWFIYARKNGAHIDEEIKKLVNRIDQTKAQKIRNNIELNGKVPK